MYSLTAVGICAACVVRAAIVCKESGDKSLISIVGIWYKAWTTDPRYPSPNSTPF